MKPCPGGGAFDFENSQIPTLPHLIPSMRPGSLDPDPAPPCSTGCLFPPACTQSCSGWCSVNSIVVTTPLNRFQLQSYVVTTIHNTRNTIKYLTLVSRAQSLSAPLSRASIAAVHVCACKQRATASIDLILASSSATASIDQQQA